MEELTDLQKKIVLDLINQVQLGNVSEEVVLEIIDLRKKLI
jgi:hypothetical protein